MTAGIFAPCVPTCMRACVHAARVNVSMYACVHVHACIYACTCVYACMRACVHVRMCTCVHACMCACMHVCMRACVHACMRASGLHTRYTAELHKFMTLPGRFGNMFKTHRDGDRLLRSSCQLPT